MRKSVGGTGKITPNRKLARKSVSRQDLRGISDKVTLKRVLGLTTTNTNGLACNPVSGIVAYPAGCVIVLYDFKRNVQLHVSNPDRKTITCLSFSRDGKYLASGESGQQPSVRVWELNENITQVAELRSHKSGIASVEFSPNGKMLVSIGDQHDMLVNVWNWKVGHTIACNKSGCRVRSVSFAESGSYLVTVGNRHVKFWYLDLDASSKGNAPITPITGRSGILGDQRNNCFTDVRCGTGKNAKFTYCVTKSSLLCMFNEKRVMDKWVELKAGSANCLVVTENFVLCGCSDGIIRVFEPGTLSFVSTFPRPHNLGVNVSDAINASDLVYSPNKSCPDVVALKINKNGNQVTCVYNDHSLYIWDTHDIKKVGKVASFLFHSACIWGVETYPYFEDNETACLPYGSFLTCSSDDTIRIWNLETGYASNESYPRNLYSKELLKIAYIDEGLTNIQDTSMAPFGKDSDGKNGIRCMQISPDGQVMATGDRSGNIRIYSLQFFDESHRIEAHESEILCVEFSPSEAGQMFLASSSRDRLIHIFDTTQDYVLLQTIDDHSSSITAVRFNYDIETLQLLSCGADKAVMFHTAQRNESGQVNFVRNTIVPGKATLCDMSIEPTRKYAATVGQDKNLRVYDIQGAKQLNCYKGSFSEGGNLLRLQLDLSGVYAAISCSDKTVNILEFESGECEATIHGHSELVTGLKFTADGKHLISVSGDGCIFVWALPPLFTENIRNRLQDLGIPIPFEEIDDPRKKTFIIPPPSNNTAENQFDTEAHSFSVADLTNLQKPSTGYRFSVGQLPLWAQKQIGSEDAVEASKSQTQPLGRWGEGGSNVAEQGVEIARFYSNDCNETMVIVGDVIYPPTNNDSISCDTEKMFEAHNVEVIVEEGEELKRPRRGSEPMNGKASDEEDEGEESDEYNEQFSPLIEHFQEIVTPSQLVTKHVDFIENNEYKPFIIGNRASISAKFLSRSQKSSKGSMNPSTLSAEEQKGRLEKLKAKITDNMKTKPVASFDVNISNNNRLTSTNRRQRRSVDVSAMSIQAQKALHNNVTKKTITSNLRKSKLISKSCQNLSFTQELEDIQNKQFMNTVIPMSPSISAMEDLLRRSSTPARHDKWKQRSVSNIETIGCLTSPQETSLRSLPPSQDMLSPKRINVSHRRKRPQSSLGGIKISKEVIMRNARSGGSRARPSSMLVQSNTVKDMEKELANLKQYHSDNDEVGLSLDGDVGGSGGDGSQQHQQHLQQYKQLFSPQQQNPLPPNPQCTQDNQQNNSNAREIDIDEQLGMHNVSSTTLAIEKEIEQECKNASLQQQDERNGVVVPEHSHVNDLIKIFGTGHTDHSRSFVHGSPPSPPERDVPHVKMNESSISSKVEDMHTKVAPQHYQKDVQKVTKEEIEATVKNLVRSCAGAQTILAKLIDQHESEEKQQMLSLVSGAYDKLEEHLKEQRVQISGCLVTNKHSHVKQSDSFKELSKSLTSSSCDVELMSLLDKYSNVVLDMLSSKLNKSPPS